MGFGQAVGLFFSRYVDFQGRSRRAEYWWVFLAQFLFYMIGGFLFVILGGEFDVDSTVPEFDGSSLIIGLLFIVIWIGLIIPNIALNVRRFHDLGQTGWLVLVFALLSLLPIVGYLASLAQLIWYIFPGNSGPNKYGPDPKNPIDTAVFE